MSANRLLAWFAVPKDSTLEIKVTGSDANFNVTGIEVTQPGGVKEVTHSALKAGTKKILTKLDTSYSTTLAIAFLGQQKTTVTVEASVTKPNGQPYGSARPPHICSGTNGQTDAAQVLAITVKN